MSVEDVRTEDQRGRSGNDVVDLAYQVVFGNRVGGGFVQLSPIDHADADMSLSDLDIPHLLIGQFLRDGFLCVRLELGQRNVRPGTHVAGRLGIGRIHFSLRDQRHHDKRRRGQRKQQDDAMVEDALDDNRYG